MAAPSSQTLEEKQSMLAHFARSPAYFAKCLLPHHIQGDVPEFHLHLYNLATATDPRKCVVVPRGFGKSTTMTLVYALHSILFEKQKFIVIISDSHHQAKLFLEAIADELKYNDDIHSYFGNITTDQWSQESITTSTKIRVVAKGSGQKLRGLKYISDRPTLMLFDDCENDEHVLTPEQRLKLRRWFYAAALPALSTDGQCFVVGTILHEDSLLNHIFENDDTFIKHKFAAIEDGKSLWEERRPLEELMKERASLIKQGLSDVWAQEYMCQAINPDTAEFRPAEFAYYDASKISSAGGRHFITIDNVSHPLNITIAVDPSMGRTKTSDYSAIVVLGAAPDNHVYVIDVCRKRLQPDALIDELLVRAAFWQPLKTRVETNGFQWLLARELKEAQRRRNIHFMIEEFRSSTNKEVRIRSLVPATRNGTLVFPERNNPQGESNDLIDELAMFPRAKNDDASDALEAALTGVISPRAKRSSRGARRQYQPASKYGGY